MSSPSAPKSVEPGEAKTAESEAPDPEPETVEPDQKVAASVIGRAKDVMARAKDILGLPAVIVTIVGGVVTLVFVFFPDLKPERSPAASRATLELVTFEPDASRRAYLERTDQGLTGFTKEQLSRRVAFVLFSVGLDGFKGKPVTLKRELIDDATGEQLSEERAITITPPKNEIKRDWHDWVLLPNRRGSSRIVLQLLAAGESAPLKTLETQPFPGLKPGESS